MKITRQSRVVLVAALIALSASKGEAQSDVAAKIDAYITPFAKAGHFSGVVIAARGGQPLFEKAYGFASAELGVPNQLDTRIGVASITKSMTGIIVRKLLEERKLSLNDKLSKFIPDFPSGEKITVEMLFRHRSGIPHRVMPPEMETVPYTTSEMIERIKLAKLEFEPGSGNLYSSAGYTVLARVLEIASGKTYSQLLEHYVFVPAGMKNSVEFNGARLIERRADDYLLDAGGYFNAPAKDYSFLAGAGSVLSTANDIHAFAMAIVSGAYGDSARANYVRTRAFWSNGSTNGHRAEVRVNGEHNYSYALVSNLNSGANDVILQALRDILEGKTVAAPVVPRPAIVRTANADLSQYLGKYEREGGSRFDVIVRERDLYAGDVKLAPTRPDCFFEFKYYGDVCFVRDASRKITHIAWASPGVTSTWVKQ
jgi:CubicO group peptidase (beta-lactamase class C family)